MATNFFGQGSKRGLLGKLTDRVRQGLNTPGGYLGPDPTFGSPSQGYTNQVPGGVTNYLAGGAAIAMNPLAETVDPSAPTATDPSANFFTPPSVGGTGGTAGQAYEPQYVQLPNGQVFDISDPAQRQAFFDARNALINQQIEQQYNQFAQQSQGSLSDAADQYSRALEGNQYDLDQLNQQLNDYNLQNERQIGDVGQAYDLGTVRRQNMFAQASPLAYQSSQGSSQQFALDQKDQALGDIARATEQTRGNFTRQEGLLSQERGDLSKNYNDYIKQSQDALNNYRQYLQDQASGQRNELSGNLASLDASQGINQFQYNRTGAQPLSTVSTDLSQYTPYLTFDSLQNAPGYNFFKSFTPSATNTLKPVDQYLGYDPTKKTQNATANYLRG